MQFRGEQEIPKLWLPHQYELQDLKFIGVNVGNHTQVLKRLRLKVLGLVDDQDGTSTVSKLAVKEIL